MKIALLNDTHCGIRNSSEIFLDYAEKFYSDCFFPYLNEHGIKNIIHLGDYYDHRKFINFKALHHNRKIFLEKLREYGITMDIIPGNHDVYFKNTNELNSLKELLGHYMNEVNIVMEPRVLEYDNTPIALIPWINSENYNQTMNFIKDCKADIVGAHLELNGFELSKGIMSHDGMDHRIFSKFDMVLSGHYHAKSHKDNIYYLGSQMEFFWSDASDPKYFHVLDTETRELTAVRNPHTLFERIYYDDRNTNYHNFDVSFCDHKFVKIVVINKSDLFTFDRFVDRIQDRAIHELKIAENFEEFLGDAVQDESVNIEDTNELLDSYIEAVDTDLDKNKLKVQMRNLLTEAQTLEIS